tara:strand:- start:1079 stop:1387 length:309 start_codon:yes stop_codon:yes gene_type:complete
MNQKQNHPLYLVDRERLNGLLAQISPNDQDLIDLARLLIRYEGFEGADDIQLDMKKTLKSWGMTRELLNSKAKEIWQNGFRPGQSTNDAIGSGFDTADGESP